MRDVCLTEVVAIQRNIDIRVGFEITARARAEENCFLQCRAGRQYAQHIIQNRYVEAKRLSWNGHAQSGRQGLKLVIKSYKKLQPMIMNIGIHLRGHGFVIGVAGQVAVAV